MIYIIRSGVDSWVTECQKKKSGRDSMGLDQVKDRPRQKYLETFENIVFWCNFKLAQVEGVQFYQTRSHPIVLDDTLPIALRKAVCMKTQDELFLKIRLISRVSRVVLESNSQDEQ